MTDPYYDDIITVALGIPGVWLSASQDGHGIKFDASRPLREVVDDLVDHFESERPWRVLPAETAVRADHAVVTVISEIDRTCNVIVNDNRAAPSTGRTSARSEP